MSSWMTWICAGQAGPIDPVCFAPVPSRPSASPVKDPSAIHHVTLHCILIVFAYYSMFMIHAMTCPPSLVHAPTEF